MIIFAREFRFFMRKEAVFLVTSTTKKKAAQSVINFKRKIV
jgi:hypothetical protein